MDYKNLSCLEVALQVVSDAGSPMDIFEIIDQVIALKEIDDADSSVATRLFMDITTSSKFTYCGDGKWDLKANESLELFDKDGSFFGVHIDTEEEDNEVSLSDYELGSDSLSDDDDDDDTDDDDEEEDLYGDEEDDDIVYDDDDDDDGYDSLDEDKYNKIMDDYEDMYDKD